MTKKPDWLGSGTPLEPRDRAAIVPELIWMTDMYWLKQRNKCGGDLASGSDQYGLYVSCMQCGRSQDIETKEAVSPVVGLKSVQLSVAVALSGGYCHGKEFSGFQSTPAYVPLFGTILTDEKLGNHAVDSPPSPP